jgi:hypothetical protein
MLGAHSSYFKFKKGKSDVNNTKRCSDTVHGPTSLSSMENGRDDSCEGEKNNII